jgi:hypothetical protein
MGSAYTSSFTIAQNMQTELDGGSSPNFVLTNNFGHWKPVSFNDLSGDKTFGVITERSKSYTTGTLEVGRKIAVPPKSFLNTTKTSGSARMLWWPSWRTHVFIQSLNYSYGDVRGYVIVGRSAMPYEIELFVCATIVVLFWLVSFYALFPPKNKFSGKSKR